MSLEEKMDLNSRLLRVEESLEKLKKDFRITDRCNEVRYLDFLSRFRKLDKKNEKS